MKLKSNLKYIATPAKIFMTAFVVLIAVSILQGIILEIERTFRLSATTKPKAEFTQEEKRLNRIRESAKEFLSDGTIHLVHKPRRTPGRMDESEIEQIYDANDDLLWEGPGNKRPYEYLSWANQLRRYRDGFTREQMKQTQMITTDFSRNVRIPVRSDNKTEQVWCYHPGTQYFKGYNTSGEKIGYAGSTGFTDSKSKVKPFEEFRLFTAWCPQDSVSPILLWQTQRHIYQIDFEKQNVEMIFESTEADIEIERTSLHAWRDLKPGAEGSSDPKNYRPLLICRTENGKHHLILREPRHQLSIGIGFPGASVTATKKNIFVRNYWSDGMPPADICGDFFYSLARMVLDIQPYGGVINRVLTVLMMIFVFLHGWPRRTSWARFVSWLVFVGLFNLAGLLTYLALNHTAVIKCPVCGKRRGLARVDCVRCQAELPAPERGKLDLIFST